MSVFELRRGLVSCYRDLISSFIKIRDASDVELAELERGFPTPRHAVDFLCPRVLAELVGRVREGMGCGTDVLELR